MPIAPTALVDGVAAARRNLTRFEKRQPAPGVINAFREGTDQLVDKATMERLRTAPGRPVKIPVLKRFAATVGNVRALNPTPNTADTAFMTPTWFTAAFSVSQVYALNANNYIDKEEEFANLLHNAVHSAVLGDNTNGLEKKLVDYLEANKYTTPPTSKVKGVAVASGAYVTTNEALPILAPSIFAELQNYGRILDISNIATLGRQNEMKAYGAGNQKNLEQFLGEMDYYRSHRIAVTATYDETHYLTTAGSLGLLNWVEFDARNRSEHFNGQYMEVQDPYFGFNWGVRMVEEAKDLSGTLGAGYERAVQIRWDFAADFAAVSAYSSVAGVTPIVKFNTVTP